MLTIPVINEKEHNALCALSDKIIYKLLSAFVANVDIETLKKSYQFSDNSETVIIFYHELMWDLLDLLLQKQVIQMPIAFRFPEKAQLADVADLCFIVIYKD